MPVGREAVAAARAYLDGPRGALLVRRRTQSSPAQTRLFVNGRGGVLTRQGLYKIVQGHAGRAGLSECVMSTTASAWRRHNLLQLVCRQSVT